MTKIMRMRSLVCDGHLSNIPSQFSAGSQQKPIKFDHIARNTLENLDKTHCIVLFRLGITFYHKNPNFKNFSLVNHFTGEDMKILRGSDQDSLPARYDP